MRLEELLNYFSYSFPPPKGRHPFAIYTEVAKCPWSPEHKLLLIALQAKQWEKRPPMNLVFLLDISGSMASPNKLPLLKKALKFLVPHLEERDQISLVVYADKATILLLPTPGNQKREILKTLDSLKPGGSTNAESGLVKAYWLARQSFIHGGVNRVIWCTDGDFNVGITDEDRLVRLIRKEAKNKIFLSLIGVGTGNLRNNMLETLSNKGRGQYAYIDTLGEAKRLFLYELPKTLLPVAKDVKIQVEFNPAKVSQYRLLGYENRLLFKEDFQNDRKSGGEINAEQQVLVLYELIPAASESTFPSDVPLKYQTPRRLTPLAKTGEIATIRVRYKPVDRGTSQSFEVAVLDQNLPWQQASENFRFATSVAAFALLLRSSPYKGRATFSLVEKLAKSSLRKDPFGLRREFLSLVEQAKKLMGK